MILKDKVVIITGGSKGFGKALAKSFINEGANIVATSLHRKELRLAEKEIGLFGVCADVTKEKDMKKLLDKAVKKFGKVDIWINNAGLWLPKIPVEELDMSLVKKLFDVNVIGLINGTRVAVKYMKVKGEGTIINVISDSALVNQPKVSASVYGASKWAVNGFTKAIREEDKNISILSIFPGAMQTSIFGKNVPNNFNDFLTPDFVAEKVVENLKLDNPEQELIVRKNP